MSQREEIRAAFCQVLMDRNVIVEGLAMGGLIATFGPADYHEPCWIDAGPVLDALIDAALSLRGRSAGC